MIAPLGYYATIAVQIGKTPDHRLALWHIAAKSIDMAEPVSAAKLRRIFVALFFTSGAAGLGYQIVWSKAFGATIGHEYPAVLAVVTAFMAGLAIGSAFLIRLSELNPKLYSWLEFLIGAWALATLFLIPSAENVVSNLLGLTPSPAFHWAIVFLAVILILLPATTAMGATLPAAERFLTSRAQGDTTALLYGANTAGATLGALVSAFWLMPAFGIRNTIIAFALINILCGFVALTLSRRPGLSPQNASKHSTNLSPSVSLRLFFAGLLGIAFEVVVIRALAHVLENTVFTFAVVLATFLIGTAVGAFAFHRTRSTLLREPTLLLALLAGSCLITALALRWSAPLYQNLRGTFGDSVLAVAGAETLLAAVFLFLPTVFMGALWSTLAQQTLSFKRTLAWSVAVNTTGAALAPALAGLIIIPLLGVKGALLLLPLGYALLAWRKRVTIPLLAIIAAAIPFTTSFEHLIQLNGDRIVHFQEGVMGSAAVLENQSGARTLKFNNRFQMGGTAARIAEERQAAIPRLLHPDPSRALFIGLGTGITFNAARYYPDLHSDGVELVPEIAAAMSYFNNNSPPVLELQTFIADGRRFVRATTNLYDVIVSDLFHPAQDGAAFLYTREHFAAIRDRIAEGGLFCQWLPVHQMDLATLRTVMNTIAQVFPHTELWLLRFNIDLPVIAVIARNTPARYTADLIEQKSNSSLRDHLKSLGLGDSLRLFGCFIGRIEYRNDLPINTDWNPTLLFTAPEITFRKNDNPSERLFTLLAKHQQSPSPLLTLNPTLNLNPQFTTDLTNFIQARDTYLRGLQHENTGNLPAAVDAYLASAKLSRHFTAGYAQALTIASSLARTNPAERERILRALVEAQPAIPVAAQLLEATK